ncbi:hypothetical protein AMECASPLE_025598 [Ameca splendens]|uniref:Uncharacterized protein n=1 Tax=Ameca splendens TaxID=208324 RepID=A0ABV0ZDL0_9TELE
MGEKEKINKLINSSLETQSCSRKLSPELMYNILRDCLAAETQWQDMRIIRYLEANRSTVETSAMMTSTKKTPTKKKHVRTIYLMEGIEVCRNIFQFLKGLPLQVYSAVKFPGFASQIVSSHNIPVYFNYQQPQVPPITPLQDLEHHMDPLDSADISLSLIIYLLTINLLPMLKEPTWTQKSPSTLYCNKLVELEYCFESFSHMGQRLAKINDTL